MTAVAEAAAPERLGPARRSTVEPRALRRRCPACRVSALARRRARPQPPLSHEGRWITDARGRVVVLHGVEHGLQGRALPARGHRVRPRRRPLPRAATASTRCASGSSTGPRAEPPAPGRPRYDDGYLGSIAAHRARCSPSTASSPCSTSTRTSTTSASRARAGPTGRSIDDGLPAVPAAGFPANYFVDPGAQRARSTTSGPTTPAPDGVGLQDRYAAAWRHVAKRFRGAPHAARLRHHQRAVARARPGPPAPSPTGCPLFDTQTLEPILASG